MAQVDTDLKIARLEEQLERALNVILKQNEHIGELQAALNALYDELDKSYASIDQDVTTLGSAINLLAETIGIESPLPEVEESGTEEVVQINTDKKVVH